MGPLMSMLVFDSWVFRRAVVSLFIVNVSDHLSASQGCPAHTSDVIAFIHRQQKYYLKITIEAHRC